MQKRSFFVFLSLFVAFLVLPSKIHAVGVQTVGSVSQTSGYYRLKSISNGQGNFTVGSNVTVDSYLFQCKSKGSAGCSTQWNSDATLVQKWQNSVKVPNLNQQSDQITHQWGNLPLGQCGRITYNQGIAGLNDAVGGWVYDFGKDCTTGPTQPAPSGGVCTTQQPVDTQVRVSGNDKTPWISGGDLSNQNIYPGQKIDVNCFAKYGSALLENGVIDVTLPNGKQERVSTTGELRNYALNNVGGYTFSCSSTSIPSCSNTDTVNVKARFPNPFFPNPSPTPTPTPTPSSTPSPTPKPTATPTPTPSTYRSSCDNLSVVSGNDSLIPAKVTLRARGSDNQGNIQKYRFYFGDGQFVETDTAEVTHEYTSSGNFSARADIKDSKGNYQTSSACEATVRVKGSTIESHKSACSNVFMTPDNNSKAPSNVKFEITGYDNKGNLQGYKLDFGNGVVKEGTGNTFEQKYNTTGTYQIKAYVKDSTGNYVGGNEGCSRALNIGSSTPLTQQPSTGMPTIIPILGAISGSAGLCLRYLKSRFQA